MTRARWLAPWLLCLLVRGARGDEGLNRIVLPGESPSAAQRLESARKLAGDGHLAEAVDEYQRLLEEAGDRTVPLTQQHFVQVRWVCQLDLAGLPPEGLRIYRNRVDGRAKKWFEQGAADRDLARLRRVVDEAFCSRYGDRALDLLGDLEFERGRFAEAEGWWRRIAAPASEGDRPPPAKGKTLALVFPDPQVDVARVRAKQILARIFQGEPFVSRDSVRAELQAFRRLHPKAEGTFAGQKGNYADTLQALLDQGAGPAGPAEPEETTTFARNAARNDVLPGEPTDPNRLSGLKPRWWFDLGTHAALPEQEVPPAKPVPASQAARALAFQPVIADGHVLVADARFVTAYDLRTGAAEVWYDAAVKAAGIHPVVALPAPPDERYTLTVAEGCVFARLGGQEVGPGERRTVLVCLGLRPDADGRRLRWALTPGGDARGGTVFEGAPVVRDGRAYVSVTRAAGGRNLTAVHCYPVHAEGTPPLRWRQDVCETPELKAEGGLRSPQTGRNHLLTLAGPNIVYCSHAGAIVALDAETGRHAWAFRYSSRGPGLAADQPWPRDLAPCVYAAGRLFAAPADYDRLLCLDPATGRLLWQRDKVETVHLLGAAGDRLVFTTPDGLRAVDAATGGDRGGWRLPDVGELPPLGRGFLAGDLVFWPTAQPANAAPGKPSYRLYVVNQSDGRQPDRLRPGTWQDIPGGNLAYGEGCLAVAGAKTLTVYVPPALLRQERERAVQDNPGSAAAHYDLAAAEAGAGLASRALEDLAEAERLAAPGECRDGNPLVDLARCAQRQIHLDAAARAEAVKHWAEAAAALARAAAVPQPVTARLDVLRREAALWAGAGEPARALAVWQAVLNEDALRAGRVALPGGGSQDGVQLAAEEIERLVRAGGSGMYEAVEQQARALLDGARDDQRTAALERLAAQYPNAAVTGPALLELARRQEQAGHLGAAAQAYRLLLRRGPAGAERPAALKGLAQVYEREGCWEAARSAWQQLAREQGERTLAAVDPDRPVRDFVAGRLREPEYRGGAPGPPGLALPLLDGWQVPLGGDERWLIAAGDDGRQGGEPLFFVRGAELRCRDARSGKLHWSRTLPGAVDWIGRHTDTVLAAGRRGVYCLRLDDGGALWSFLGGPDAGACGAACTASGAGLTDFRLAAGRLFFRDGERRLAALDADSGGVLWTVPAPAAGLGLPYPSGRFFPFFHADPDWVVAQTAGGQLWVLDSRTGRTLHDLETSRDPWPRPPLPLGDGRLCLVTDPGTVLRFDPAAGRELGRSQLRAATTLSGEAPAVVGNGDALLLLVPRNYGLTLQRIDPHTGEALWEDERPLGTDSIPPEAVAVGGDAAYLATGDLLSARALADGRELWTVPLPGPGRDWHTLLTRDYLVAYPADVGCRGLRLDGFFGSLRLTATFPIHERMTAGVPVLFYDPKTGQLVQRLNLPAAGPQAAAGRSPRLLPAAELETAPLLVRVSDGALVAVVGGMACGRVTAAEEQGTSDKPRRLKPAAR